MWAMSIHAVELSIDFSQSLASLRHLPSHAKVRSTKAVYRMVMAPTFAWGLSAMPAVGKVSWSARYAALVAATSQQAGNEFADTVVGKSNVRRKQK